MSILEIEDQIKKLSADKVRELAKWITDYNARIRMDQIAAQSDALKIDDGDDLIGFSLANLESGYSDREPDYTLDLIIEKNPEYEGR